MHVWYWHPKWIVMFISMAIRKPFYALKMGSSGCVQGLRSRAHRQDLAYNTASGDILTSRVSARNAVAVSKFRFVSHSSVNCAHKGLTKALHFPQFCRTQWFTQQLEVMAQNSVALQSFQEIPWEMDGLSWASGYSRLYILSFSTVQSNRGQLDTVYLNWMDFSNILGYSQFLCS